MSANDSQYLMLIDLLLDFKGKGGSKWVASPYGSGFHLDINGKSSIFLQQREGPSGDTKGYSLTVYDEFGERKGPVFASQVDNSQLYLKLKQLFEQAKEEADSNLDDISGVIDQLRSIAH